LSGILPWTVFDDASSFFFASWTVITWLVVVGSTVVMLLWIIVYSFFSTPDFNDEVTILFGNMTFWSTVFLTATICLGTALVLQRKFGTQLDLFSPSIYCQILDYGVFPAGQVHHS
jgi:hypothetical protein